MVEHLTCNEDVAGSMPVAGPPRRSAVWFSVPGLGVGRRRFKSCHLDKESTMMTFWIVLGVVGGVGLLGLLIKVGAAGFVFELLGEIIGAIIEGIFD